MNHVDVTKNNTPTNNTVGLFAMKHGLLPEEEPAST
jgi:hypothetical protein